MGFNISFALFLIYPFANCLQRDSRQLLTFNQVLFKFKVTLSLGSQSSFTISSQSAKSFLWEKEHAFADDFIKFHTKQGPAAQLPRVCRTHHKRSIRNRQLIHNLGSEKSESRHCYWFLTKLNILAIQKLLQFALLHFALKKLLHFALESCYISLW